MMRRFTRHPVAVLAAVVVLLLSTVGMVYALKVSISSDGYMYACYSIQNGTVRLRSRGATCGPGWVPTRWYAAAPPTPERRYVRQASGEVTLTTQEPTIIAEAVSTTPDGAWPRWNVNATVRASNSAATDVRLACELKDIIFNDDSGPWDAVSIANSGYLGVGAQGSIDDALSFSMIGLTWVGYGAHPAVVCRAAPDSGSAEPMNLHIHATLVIESLPEG